MRFTQPPPSCATPLSANEILVPAKTEPVIVEDKLNEVNINITFILNFISDFNKLIKINKLKFHINIEILALEMYNISFYGCYKFVKCDKYAFLEVHKCIKDN